MPHNIVVLVLFWEGRRILNKDAFKSFWRKIKCRAVNVNAKLCLELVWAEIKLHCLQLVINLDSAIEKSVPECACDDIHHGQHRESHIKGHSSTHQGRDFLRCAAKPDLTFWSHKHGKMPAVFLSRWFHSPLASQSSLIRGSATFFQSMPPVMHIHNVMAAVPRPAPGAVAQYTTSKRPSQMLWKWSWTTSHVQIAGVATWKVQIKCSRFVHRIRSPVVVCALRQSDLIQKNEPRNHPWWDYFSLFLLLRCSRSSEKDCLVPSKLLLRCRPASQIELMPKSKDAGMPHKRSTVSTSLLQDPWTIHLGIF